MINLTQGLPKIDPDFGEIKQIAYVVDDLDLALAQWNKRGVTHFLVTRNASPLANAFYRGNKIGKLMVDLAFAYSNGMQLEFIQQVNDLPSMFVEEKHRREELPHHYGVCVEDFNNVYSSAVASEFAPVLNCGYEGLAQMAYIESNSEPNLMLEVIEWNDLTKPYFLEIERLWHAADSTQMIHTFDLKKLTPLGAIIKMIGKLTFARLAGQKTST